MGSGEVLPVRQLGFKRGMAGRDALAVDGYNLGPAFFGERVDANVCAIIYRNQFALRNLAHAETQRSGCN
jgi:hypothetical protein